MNSARAVGADKVHICYFAPDISRPTFCGRYFAADTLRPILCGRYSATNTLQLLCQTQRGLVVVAFVPLLTSGTLAKSGHPRTADELALRTWIRSVRPIYHKALRCIWSLLRCGEARERGSALGLAPDHSVLGSPSDTCSSWGAHYLFHTGT